MRDIKTVFAVALLAGSLHAATVTLSSGGTAGGSGFTNTRTWNAGSFTVTVQAFTLAGSAFQNSQILQYPTGLGICNQGEGLNCGSPSHQVDNNGYRDFVLFTFSVPVYVTSVVIDPWGTYDRDVQYFMGNVALPQNLNGVTLAGLGALGFGAAADNAGTVGSGARTVAIGGPAVTALLFGTPGVGGTFDGNFDFFKVTSVSAEQAPEPGTLVLLGCGLAALGLIARQRK